MINSPVPRTAAELEQDTGRLSKKKQVTFSGAINCAPDDGSIPTRDEKWVIVMVTRENPNEQQPPPAIFPTHFRGRRPFTISYYNRTHY